MSKIVENTTASAIYLDEVGVLLAPSDPYVVPATDYLHWSTEESNIELAPYILSGDITVSNGVYILPAIDGLFYLRYPDAALNILFLPDEVRGNGFSSYTVQEAIEEGQVAPNGKLEDFEYMSQGVTANKSLNIGHPSKTSDELPLVCPWAGEVVGIAFSNTTDESDTDLEIHVNGVLQYTWQIRSKRTAWTVNTNGLLNIAQGDRLSMYAKDAGTTSPRNISGEIYIRLSEMGTGSGGTDIGV